MQENTYSVYVPTFMILKYYLLINLQDLSSSLYLAMNKKFYSLFQVTKITKNYKKNNGTAI